jgi:hypothetical protein
MNVSRIQLARAEALLRRFELEKQLLPQDAERLIVETLRACGHEVTDQGFIESDTGVDCHFQTEIDGRRQRIAVEVKFTQRPLSESRSIEIAARLKQNPMFDRAIIVSRAGFTREAYEQAESLGEIDLLSPPDLWNWLSKPIQPEKLNEICAHIVRRAMRELARRLAVHPEELPTVEWRDLERILRETFEGIGFDTELTRSAKDGGFDLELTIVEDGQRSVYLVEVKHWRDQKPGKGHLKKLVEVAVSRKASSALLLSTSGFTRTVYKGMVEFSGSVHLGDRDKIIALCRAYYRLGTELWVKAHDLEETLFAETQIVPPVKRG